MRGEGRRGPVPHPVPGRADVGLQVCNPVAGHVVGMPVSEMVHDHPSELAVGHIVEDGTGNVDPDNPVGYGNVLVPVIWIVGSPGVGPETLVFPIAESWTCLLAEIAVPVASNLVAHRQGNVDPVAGNVVQMTFDESQLTRKI